MPKTGEGPGGVDKSIILSRLGICSNLGELYRKVDEQMRLKREDNRGVVPTLGGTGFQPVDRQDACHTRDRKPVAPSSKSRVIQGASR